MALPTHTAQVNVTFDATTKQITIAGDGVDTAKNEIQIWVGYDYTINLNVVTVDPSTPAAVLQDLGFDSPGQPPWLSSAPQSSGNSPAWTLTAQNGTLNEAAGVDLFVGLPNTEPTMLDPSIINVDPP